jgi:O-antigen ligase
VASIAGVDRPVHPAVNALTVFIVVLIAVPSRLIVAPLGGAGTPAEIVGVLLFVWWLITIAFRSRTGGSTRRPARIAGFVFAAAVLASYIAATIRPIASNELRAADLGLLSTIAWLGIMLVTSEGALTWNDLNVLLRRLTYAGAALAMLGLLQFATKQPFTNYIQIPGLSVNNELTSLLDRGGLVRPAGTALHPIEFGAVLTTILPISLHYAMTDTGRHFVSRWLPVVSIAFAVPISISRSAIVSAAIVLCVMIPSWPKSARRKTYAALVTLFGCIYVLVPGLLGTLTGLFTGISEDNSAASRTGSYSLAWDFITRSPLFGRGFRTFLSTYRILDNQYLGTMIDMGFVGLVTLLGLFITALVTAVRIRRSTDDPRVRGLARALIASVAAAACSFALYDAFSFPMAASLVFFIIGAVGALHRLATAGGALSSDEDSSRIRPRNGRLSSL